MDTVTSVLMLLTGLALGAAVAWAVLRSQVAQVRAEEAGRGHAEVARAQSEAAQARADVAQARAETAHARAEAADARERLAHGQTEIARAQADAADARAEVAQVGSALAGARAERDAARERAQQLSEDRDALVHQFKALSAETLETQGKRADATAQERLKATEQLLRPVAQNLQAFADRLTAVEKERIALATDLRNQVQAVQMTGEHLRRETHALATALRKPHQRGAWGELQLKRVAEVAGMLEHCDFTLQHTTSADDRAVRPDMRVALGDGKCLFVDAKVPLASFLEAHEADDDTTRSAALARFAENVRTHINQLSDKRYWQAEEGTPEFTVLFLPSEALGAEALAQSPDLHEYAAQRNIVLATPTTLIATLRAVAYGWKQAALAESAAEVFRLGRELHDRLATMGGHFDKLGRALDRTVAAYNSTLSSLETRVLVSARRFSELKVTDADLGSATPVETPTRRVSQSELVEDAAGVPAVLGRPEALPAPAISSATSSTASRTADLPEADALRRGEPELFDLVESDTDERSDDEARRPRATG